MRKRIPTYNKLPLADSKFPLPRGWHLCRDREEREESVLGGRQQRRLAATGKRCCRYLPGKKKVAKVWWDFGREPVRGYRRGPPQLRGAVGRVGASSALLPVFLLQVGTLRGLPAHNSAVHWLVVDFEVGQVRRLRVNRLTVVR